MTLRQFPRLVLACCMLTLGVGADFARAESTDIQSVREAIKRNIKNVTIDEVRTTPVAGIFEVVTDQDVFYIDRSGRYAFLDGRMVDVVTKTDLTLPTLDRLAQIDFKSLPKELAIKRVNGNGRRQLAMFADPNCSACRQLDAELGDLADSTIYIYPLPIVSPESLPASIATWCEPPNKRLARWQSFMAGEPAPKTPVPAACESAKSILSKIAAFADKYQIHNTPTLVLPNNQRIVGAMPIAELDAALSAATKGAH